jgi:hypothetical protein
MLFIQGNAMPRAPIIGTNELPNPSKRLLELINEFRKVSEWKINMQNSLSFIHTNNEFAKK